MALRTIVLDGDPILRKVCRPVEKFDDRLAQLLDDMVETMHEAEGAGLAAPQVGVMRRAIVVDVGDERGVIELVNPEIIAAAGEQEGHEGCLSFPGKWGIVVRPMTVTVRAQDRHGEWFEITGEALKARAFCHEIDHLNGVCFVDLAKRMLEPGEEE
ncbi:MAG TPA: peptide deformylase [Oscillospiraceae bacterium]|nr:peptide deformylase [Oscillospiraceae bacterium]HNW04605.1 peptide deformylase [Oscillospiraceae bacterium]HPW00096.1 peptide deformylase [Oscillospiraceae bacterium]